VNGYTLTCYLQSFSDDRLMAIMRDRMSDSDMEALFNMLGRLLKTYLTDKEYHQYFLKEKE
ncbi:MAG: cytoplasmic protein, partial [Pseudomonadota bacterium]